MTRLGRLKAWGTLVESLHPCLWRDGGTWDAWDALADLMTDHATETRDHRAEIWVQERQAQRESRDCYDDGYQAGAVQSREG